MRSVNIAELKNRLSRYLDEVRRGEEILIRDRQRPIAKLVPLSSTEDLNAEEAELAVAGLLRLPHRTLPDTFWSMPGPEVSLEVAVSAVLADRRED